MSRFNPFFIIAILLIGVGLIVGISYAGLKNTTPELENRTVRSTNETTCVGLQNDVDALNEQNIEQDDAFLLQVETSNAGHHR